MPIKGESRRSRYIEVDGGRCLPWLWRRFSREKTTAEGGRRVYRELIVHNCISCSVPGPCTHREIVEQIATNSRQRIPVDSLPKNLGAKSFSRRQAILGFSGDYFDRVARNYKDMQWWVSKRGLKMEVIAITEINISS